jgi:hypothetical protein
VLDDASHLGLFKLNELAAFLREASQSQAVIAQRHGFRPDGPIHEVYSALCLDRAYVTRLHTMYQRMSYSTSSIRTEYFAAVDYLDV